MANSISQIHTGTTGILPVAADGLAPDMPEPEIVAHLFKLYADKVKVLDIPA